MANYLTTDTDLIAVADAIRERGGTEALLRYPDEYITAILNIPSGNNTSIIEYTDPNGGTVIELTAVDLSQDTVAPQYLLSGYTAHNRSGEAITGTFALTERTASDVTISGATITIPVGYYSAQVSKSVAFGTAGTPIATKGTVSDHSINITPSVTNTTGYITGDTKTGTAITVAASELVSGTKSITANGTNIDVINYAAVNVNVEENIPTFTANIDDNWEVVSNITCNKTYAQCLDLFVNQEEGRGILLLTETNGETSRYDLVATRLDNTLVYHNINYYGYSFMDINYESNNTLTVVMDPIPLNNNDSVTISGATVTVPWGYYNNSVTKSITTMTLPTSATSSATSGYTSKATISRSTSAQYINIPVGYNFTASYYTINATPNGTVTAPSSISGTTATVSTGTNTLTLTKTVSVTPNVTTAGYISAGTAGNANVSLTASVTTKAAATITPGTSNQTIAAGTYLTGTQTISGDADLVASNIISTANIFGVQGSVVINKYYTGSSAPSASLGNNGDIYLQTS